MKQEKLMNRIDFQSGLISQILRRTGKSLYELGLDIGCSETTLWKYRNGYDISPKFQNLIEEKILTFIK